MVSTSRRGIQNKFLTGVVIVVPIGMTVILLRMMFTWLDSWFAPLVFRLFDKRIPGLGIITTILLIFAVGLLVTNIVGKACVSFGEQMVAKIPLIRNVYSGAKQLMETLTTQQRQIFTQVVLLEYPQKGNYTLGFVTSDAPQEIQEKFSEPLLSVFVTKVPNPIMGFLLLVPKKDAIPMSISVEDGLTMIVSGGIIYPPEFIETLSRLS